jgi:hypothetical protein
MQPESGLFGVEQRKEVKFYNAALLMVLAAILVPLWIVKYPGMVDYPNHLARCYILAHYRDNPFWQQLYYVDRSPLPNLAIDLIVTPLLGIMPLIVAGKVFLSLTAVLYVVGCSEVGRAVTGKPNWLALICAFTFYNSLLLYGFVNYIFGVGVLLCVLALWLRIRNAMTPLRFLLLCLLSMVAFLAHISSIVILGVVCCTIALIDFARDRRFASLLIKLAWLASPIVFVGGFLKKHNGQTGTIDWGSPSEKLIALLAPIRSYSTAMDVVLIVVLLLCALAMLGGSKVHSSAIVSIVLFALLLITPKALWANTGWGADARYVVPAFMLLILSIEPRWGRWQKVALVVALAAMVLRTGSITASWLTISQRSEQVLAMGKALPAGARIYAMSFDPGTDTQSKLDRGFEHVIQFWTVSNGVEVSNLFAVPGSQPLLFRQPPCGGPEWTKCLASYDYVWTYDPPTSIRQDLVRTAVPEAAWERVTLWRVNGP